MLLILDGKNLHIYICMYIVELAESQGKQAWCNYLIDPVTAGYSKLHSPIILYTNDLLSLALRRLVSSDFTDRRQPQRKKEAPRLTMIYFLFDRYDHSHWSKIIDRK